MSGKKAKISDLIPDNANFNTGNEYGEGLIEKSFAKFGAGRSVLLDKNNRIIAGNKSTQKFVESGGENVIIVETTGDTLVAVKRTDIDLDSKQGREMALADNATAKANISWDAAKITEWEMPYQEWGIDLAEIVEPVTDNDAEPQIDKAAELNEKWQVASGDLWQIGENKLLCGSSTEPESAKRLFNGKKAEMCFTDPPYNVQIDYNGYEDDQSDDEYRSFSGMWLSIARDISPQVLFTPGFGRGLGMPNIQMWYQIAPPDWVMVWVKTNAMSRSSLGGFNNWEPIFFYGKHQKTLPQDIFDVPITAQKDAADEDGNKYHPTPKSVKLWQSIIETLTDRGNTVYEPFGGSGTTLVASQNIGRKCFAIELSPNYCAVILERMHTAFPDIEIKRIEQAEAAKS